MTATDREPLSPGQSRVYRALLTYWAEHGRCPAIRDLCAALGFASTNAVAVHLKHLAAKGYIVLGDGDRAKARFIEIPELLDAARAAAREYLTRLGEQA